MTIAQKFKKDNPKVYKKAYEIAGVTAKAGGDALKTLNSGNIIVIGKHLVPVIADQPGAEQKIREQYAQFLEKKRQRSLRIVANRVKELSRRRESKEILILNPDLSIKERFTGGPAKFAREHGISEGTVKSYLSRGYKYKSLTEKKEDSLIYCYTDDYDAYVKAKGVILPEVDKPDPNQLKLEFNVDVKFTSSKISKILPQLIKKGYTVDYNGVVKNPEGNIIVGSIIEGEGFRKFSIRTESNSSYPIRVHKLQAYIKFGDESLKSGVVVKHINGNTLDNSYDNISIVPKSIVRPKIPVKQNRAGIPAEVGEKIMADRANNLSYRNLVAKYGIPKTTIIDFVARQKNTPVTDQVAEQPTNQAEQAPLFDIDREDLYEYGRPELNERTRSRLTEISKLGMSEVGYANFGIRGVMSGLFIERIWSDSDEVFRDYIDWVKGLIIEKQL